MRMGAMYTAEQRRIINLADGYTLMYAFLVRGLIDACGIDGEASAREGTRRYGADRGVKSRERHIAMGAKVNMVNLFTLTPDLPPDPRFRRERQELNPQERVSHTLVCPMADLWIARGEMAVGRIYCEEFHFACYNAYGFGHTQVNLAKTLTQEGDNYCSFNVILRPENLPARLRPACFAEYDPEWNAPDLSGIGKPDAKTGFNSLWIRLYYHLLAAADDMIGDPGREAIGVSLGKLASDEAAALRAKAAAAGLPFDEAFVEANYPLSLQPDDDPHWIEYSGHGALGLLKERFCAPFIAAAGFGVHG